MFTVLLHCDLLYWVLQKQISRREATTVNPHGKHALNSA